MSRPGPRRGPLCPNGHPRTPENTARYRGWWKEGSYRLRCKVCDQERSKRTHRPATPEQNRRSSIKRAQSRPMRQCSRCGEIVLPGFRGPRWSSTASHHCPRKEPNWGGVLCSVCGAFKGERNRRDAICDEHLGPADLRYRSDAALRQSMKDKARHQASIRRSHYREGDFITIAALIERDGDRCYLCGAQVSDDRPVGHPLKANIEHVVPLSAGGTHTLDNVRVACRGCNATKGAKLAA